MKKLFLIIIFIFVGCINQSENNNSNLNQLLIGCWAESNIPYIYPKEYWCFKPNNELVGIQLEIINETINGYKLLSVEKIESKWDVTNGNIKIIENRGFVAANLSDGLKPGWGDSLKLDWMDTVYRFGKLNIKKDTLSVLDTMLDYTKMFIKADLLPEIKLELKL